MDILKDKPGSWRGRDSESAQSNVVPVDESRVNDNFDLLNTILTSSKLTSVEEVFRALDGCSISVSAHLVNKILRRFANDWVSAYGFFKWVATTQSCYEHCSDSFDLMVDILGKSKQFDAMWGLVEEMGHEKLVSLATMSKVMRRLSGAGRWKDAIETFHKIEKIGLEKDTMAMNVLLDTLCKERSAMRARDFFFEVRESIPPDATTFNILIHGWCKARKLEEARWTMEDMRESRFIPCVITYTSLIEAYCMDKNFRAVNATLEEMKSNGCSPNVITYTIVMHSLGKAKETQEALRVYEMMKRDGCVPDTSFYNSLIYILGSGGQLRDALSIYEEMHRNGSPPNVITYNTLISSACVHSQEEKALSLLLKMEESSCKPDIRTYSPLLKYCCRRKRTQLLYFLLGDMLKKDISIDLGTYTLLVQGLCRNGKLHQSCSFFEKMVLKGFIPWEHTYEMLLKELERKKLNEEKEIIIKLMARAVEQNSSGYHYARKKNQTG
ncbi:unnamed protein product [Spirodela intermedia]|uniref:Uncharacterized protein n=1 Tax=Spirodela intermedia TaxID=51605 RepID=A0A7I8KMX5_SPIIN|nr:unnamed protein product [Spirodela intermedia]